MKNIFIIFFSVFAGFFAGYMVTRPDPEMLVPAPRSTVPVVVRSTSQNPDTEEVETLSFTDIDNQSSVFAQQLLAHQLAAAANTSQLEDYILESLKREDPLYNFNLVSIFLERYTEIDPLSALAFVQERNELLDNTFVAHVLTSWVRFEPEAALDYFEAIDNRVIKESVGRRLLTDNTLKAAGLHPRIIDILGYESRIIAQQAQLDLRNPANAFQSALENNDPQLRNVAFSALAMWIRQQPQEALAYVQNLQHPNKDQFLQTAISQYANQDPQAAYEYFRQRFPNNVRLEQQILSVYGNRDPDAAFPLVEEFVQRTGNASPMSGLLSAMMRTNPQRALQYADGLPYSQKDRVYGMLASTYAQTNPEEAVRWMLGLPEDMQVRVQHAFTVNETTVNLLERSLSRLPAGVRQGTLASIANYRSRNNPEDALSWLDGYTREPGYDAARQQVLMNWTHSNPRAVAEFIDKNPDTEGMQAIIQNTFSNWYRADANAANRWLARLPAGDNKNAAINSAIQMTVRQDLDAAIDLLSQLPSGDMRTQAEVSIAYSWLHQNRGDVDGILGRLNLPANIEADLRRQAEQIQGNGQNAFIRTQ